MAIYSNNTVSIDLSATVSASTTHFPLNWDICEAVKAPPVTVRTHWKAVKTCRKRSKGLKNRMRLPSNSKRHANAQTRYTAIIKIMVSGTEAMRDNGYDVPAGRKLFKMIQSFLKPSINFL